ncbi:MAG: NusG domain II-containing protein [Clostridia bacterium]|nr:NusG domain II-containing protein [Clostridia bacterium]
MLFKRGDIIIIIVLIVCAALIYMAPAANNDADTLVITVDGKEYRRIDLSDKDYYETIEIDGKYKNIIEVKNGSAAFIYADCPDGDCVRSGVLSPRHNFAACLPNRVSISIVSSGSELDALAG